MGINLVQTKHSADRAGRNSSIWLLILSEQLLKNLSAVLFTSSPGYVLKFTGVAPVSKPAT